MIAILVVVLLIVGGYFLFQHLTKKKETGETSSSTSTTQKTQSSTAAASTTTPTPAPWLEAHTMDFHGNDLPGSPFITTDGQACAKACQGGTGCVASAYSPATKNCWLKSSLAGANVRNEDRITYLPPTAPKVATWKKTLDFDLPGSDIACLYGSKGADVGVCASACNLHAGCKAYNQVKAGYDGNWPVGGCCIKTAGGPLVPTAGINFYSAS